MPNFEFGYFGPKIIAMTTHGRHVCRSLAKFVRSVRRFGDEGAQLVIRRFVFERTELLFCNRQLRPRSAQTGRRLLESPIHEPTAN